MLKVKYKLLDMKVAIIQISDIHLSGARDFIVSRLKLVAIMKPLEISTSESISLNRRKNLTSGLRRQIRNCWNLN